MSQRHIEYVVDKLLMDGALRMQFAFDRLLAIAEIQTLGFELTSDEIDAFVQSDIRCWFCETGRVPGRAH